VVGTTKGRIGKRPWHTCQTTLFNLHSKSLIEKLRYVKSALACFIILIGYRTPAEVAYKYATVNGNGIKNSEVVL